MRPIPPPPGKHIPCPVIDTAAADVLQSYLRIEDQRFGYTTEIGNIVIGRVVKPIRTDKPSILVMSEYSKDASRCFATASGYLLGSCMKSSLQYNDDEIQSGLIVPNAELVLQFDRQDSNMRRTMPSPHKNIYDLTI